MTDKSAAKRNCSPKFLATSLTLGTVLAAGHSSLPGKAYAAGSYEWTKQSDQDLLGGSDRKSTRLNSSHT